MRSSVRFLTEAVLLSILAMWVLLPWGCGQSPLAPDTNPNTLALPNGALVHPGQLLTETEPAAPGIFTPRSGGTEANAAGEVVFGPFSASLDVRGGEILIDLNGDTSYFLVPEAALSAATNISVTVIRNENADGDRITVFTFEPSGLVFAVPANLAYRSALSEGEIQKLYWYDPASDTWFASAVAVSSNGYAAFPVAHFSDFGTVERISLGGQ